MNPFASKAEISLEPHLRLMIEIYGPPGLKTDRRRAIVHRVWPRCAEMLLLVGVREGLTNLGTR